MKMALYVEYWEDVLLHLSKSLPLQSPTLLEGFWPSSNWRFNYARALLPTRMEVVDAKDPLMRPYCKLRIWSLLRHTHHFEISTMGFCFGEAP
jgi:hypothetical protein